MGQRPALIPRAMVLAAGAGTRLRPLTHETPKPMVPVANRPVLHHVLENLARTPIKEAVLNLHAHPEQVRAYVGDGSRYGLKITYSVEKELLGTAGSIKKVESHFRGAPILVLSGDGLHDVDLNAFIAIHKKRKALASMVTKAVDQRFDYGVTLADRRGRIKGFLEKPTFGSFFSNQANTGIYLFEPEVLAMIPKGFYDFGHDLWPKLLEEKKAIYSWEWSGYWCDVGNLTEFRRSNADALANKVRLNLPGRTDEKSVRIEKGAKIHKTARLEGPCLIGAGAEVGQGVLVGPGTVIGAKAKIGARATLKNCILFDEVVVGRSAYLVNCVAGRGCRIQPGTSAYNAELLNSRN